MKYLLVFLFFIVFSCNSKNEVISTPIIAYIKVDKVKTTVGDTINVTLTIDKDNNIKENILNIKKAFSDFILYQENVSNSKYENNRAITEFKYKLQVPKKGTYVIEPIEIEYIVPKELENIFGKSSKTKTSKIFVEVKTNLTKEDENKDIEDIKPLVDISYISTKILLVTIVCILIAMIIIYFLFKVLYKKEEKLPYYKHALEELKNIDLNNTKQACFIISNIVRKFIDETFELKTLEKTVEEIEYLIEKIDIENKNELINLLKNIDIYKFTEIKSNKDELNLFVNKAIDFIKINVKEKENVK